MKYQWMVGGEAGFGIMTTGLSFAKIASRSGFFVFDYVEYPSLIRGGHNAYRVTFDSQPVHSLKETVDVLICLNNETYEFHKSELSKNGVVVYDPEDFTPPKGINAIPVPFRAILTEGQGQSIMKNTIALGASLAVIGGDLGLLKDIIAKQFARKGEQVVAFNTMFAQKGYDAVMNSDTKLRTSALAKNTTASEKVVLSGNDAFALGAVMADCKFYCAYPMTPSSSVLTSLASWQDKGNITVRHAEDEIAVINSAIGAAHGGVRAAVGSSGGGFALMVEALSLAGITETPIVVFLSQRPGPATGMPTWTEQGDLLFAVHSGHGEFPKIVLAPGDPDEMVHLTVEAFNLADIYQTPVIILSDMYLSESHRSIESASIQRTFTSVPLNRGKTVRTPTQRPYLRYKITDDGVSERLIPGAQGFYYQANSYEHHEDGHTTEGSEDRVNQVRKRERKQQMYLKRHFTLPAVYGDLKTADTVLVCWGSMKGICLDAMAARKNTAVIHVTHLYPLDSSRVRELFGYGKNYVLVEQNATSQFGTLLREQTGVTIEKTINRFDGRPMTVTEILTHL